MDDIHPGVLSGHERHWLDNRNLSAWQQTGTSTANDWRLHGGSLQGVVVFSELFSYCDCQPCLVDLGLDAPTSTWVGSNISLDLFI